MSRPGLARDVAIVVTLKTAIVIAAAIFIFGPKQRPAVDSLHVQQRILGNFTPSEIWSDRQ